MNQPHANPIVRQLESDLQQVNARLLDSLTSLGGPLGELVRAQVPHARPYFRAAAVFTATYSTIQVGSTKIRSHQARPLATADETLPPRITTLAAAVEMLYIALNVHKQLVQASPHAPEKQVNHQENLDRTFLGSTILAGDYCFSRAAQLAAATENPQVVARFAQALEILSEGLLRQVFHNPVPAHAPVPDLHRTLIISGIESALLLIQPDEAVRAAVLAHAAPYADVVEHDATGHDENLDRSNGHSDNRQVKNGQTGSGLPVFSPQFPFIDAGSDSLTQHLAECWAALTQWQATAATR